MPINRRRNFLETGWWDENVRGVQFNCEEEKTGAEGNSFETSSRSYSKNVRGGEA